MQSDNQVQNMGDNDDRDQLERIGLGHELIVHGNKRWFIASEVRDLTW